MRGPPLYKPGVVRLVRVGGILDQVCLADGEGKRCGVASEPPRALLAIAKIARNAATSRILHFSRYPAPLC